MRVLAIESSCDETGAAVLEKSGSQVIVLSNVLATSSDMHAKTGGIIPEQAAREQVKAIIPVIVEALIQAFSKDSKDFTSNFLAAKDLLDNIDAIAVTYGPGLIGSLIIGVETAKTLSFVLNKPLIPVNHLLAHLYANFITDPKAPTTIDFPFIGLIVSGGHTDLLYFKSHDDHNWLGGTRDDAAGEALDKIGRILNLPYPAGPEIERRANLATSPTIKFSSPLINSDDYDFSFSGLKTQAMRYVLNNPNPIEKEINEICYATQKAIIDVLVRKTLKATNEYNCETILLGGGVSANQTLIKQLKIQVTSHQSPLTLFAPQKEYSTDNAAMIGAYALMNGKETPWQEVSANPDLYFA